MIREDKLIIRLCIGSVADPHKTATVITNNLNENYKLKIYASTVKSKNNFEEQDFSV